MNITTLILTGSLLWFAGCTSSTHNDNATLPPNIVFLFADDYTYSALHASGNSTIHTPNLDRLASGGVTFTHAYNMGGWHGAICVASRSMLISGVSLWKAKTLEESWMAGDSMALNRTWGQLMRQRGYDTYMTGKWHVQVPPEKVFDRVKNIRPGMPPDYWVGNDSTWRILGQAFKAGQDIMPLMPLGYNRPLNESDTTWSAADRRHGGYWQGGIHWSEVVKNDALEFIEAAEHQHNPFFMYLAFNAPHDPRQAPQEYLDKYEMEDIPLPENWLPQYPYMDSIGNTPLLRDEALAPYPRSPHSIKTHIKEYYAIISHLDDQIGQILKALEEKGLMENTYIFFTGDHGLSVGHHGLIGKQSLYDHSIRVPLLVAGPDIPQGSTSSSEVYLQDIMATSLELAGITKPDYVDFESFLSQAQGESGENRLANGVYGAYVDFQRMIRKDGYKLLLYPKLSKVLLFDLKDDPEEQHDLSGLPEHRERVRSLFADLIVLQKEMADPLNLQEMYEDWLQP